ncbi:rhomboid family intramembrane serine protease [Plebeiibacterium marinum]|uniref:Rhomboid family intramembrane serine protease n=1 Tax=Plebeiibacterium marinum TaxID=2992111 RepID=A0AAE3MF67_9BACT|nr:rhomboid family intramembrane serine protease [Plebeiobacterium marinum]MCW3806451.1 rhomboid family intramembrane serine protease [Plebeiobacterium marinum]
MFQRQSIFSNIPPIIKNILIINALAFIAMLLFSKGFSIPGIGFTRIDLNSIFGLYTPGSNQFHFFQYITYMFMHGGFEHIFFNMLALFMLGSAIERTWGSQKFLFYYLATGIGAGLIYVLVAFIRARFIAASLPPEIVSEIYEKGFSILSEYKNYVDTTAASLNRIVNVPMVGASGAVFGILLAFGMLFPNEYIYIQLIFPVKAKYFVMIYGALETFLMLQNNRGDNVAHLAHLGGMLVGFIIIRFWQRKQF